MKEPKMSKLFRLAPTPSEESERLKALLECQILDTSAEPVFDAYVRAVAEACDTPVALISLVDRHRQWFKAKIGLDVDQTPRDIAFCGHTILQTEAMVINDAAEDERFRHNPLVTGEPFIRFYAGVPLRLLAGERLGSLCVIDFKPRTISEQQLDLLNEQARQIASILDARRARFKEPGLAA